MIERIKKILSVKKLTPRQFAEEIGIQPSGMSHILSGRNRPSLDFVVKVLGRYPDISTQWLVMGKGDIFTNINIPNITSQDDEEQTLFTSDIKPKVKDIAESTIPQQKADENPPTEPPASSPQPLHQSPMLHNDPQPEAKKIERVLVFYNDKTFSEYRPEWRGFGKNADSPQHPILTMLSGGVSSRRSIYQTINPTLNAV